MTWAYFDWTGSRSDISKNINDFLNALSPFAAMTAKTIMTDQQNGTPRGAVFHWTGAESPLPKPEIQRWSSSTVDGYAYQDIVDKLNAMTAVDSFYAHVSATNAHDHSPTITVYSSVKDVEDGAKVSLLKGFAPKVWLHSEESFFPSSVEWTFPQEQRYREGADYWFETNDKMPEATSILDYFHGNQNLTETPVYGFWADKGDGDIDLVYFFFYPYNRGKEAFGTTFGNHVGDWEHITVRLSWFDDGNGGQTLAPVKIALEAHGDVQVFDWDDDAVAKEDRTHPIVYAAKGSHGLWQNAGAYVYRTILTHDLIDYTNAGTAWDTWTNMQMFDFDEKRGLDGATWPVWMSDVFTGGNADPTSGGVYRWGNDKRGGFEIGNIELYKLADGPTGPISKNT